MPGPAHREGRAAPRPWPPPCLTRPSPRRRGPPPRGSALTSAEPPRRGGAARAPASLPAGVVEGFEGAEVPPRRGKAVLQELPAALARGLEQLYVASQPGLEGEQGQNEGCGSGRPSPSLPVWAWWPRGQRAPAAGTPDLGAAPAPPHWGVKQKFLLPKAGSAPGGGAVTHPTALWPHGIAESHGPDAGTGVCGGRGCADVHVRPRPRGQHASLLTGFPWSPLAVTTRPDTPGAAGWVGTAPPR